MMSVKSQLLHTNEAIAKLQIDSVVLQDKQKVEQANKDALLSLKARLQHAKTAEINASATKARKLGGIPNYATKALISQSNAIQANANKALSSHLITRTTHAQQLTSAIQLKASYASMVSQGVAIQNSIADLRRQGSTLAGQNHDLSALNAAEKEMEIAYKVSEIDNSLLNYSLQLKQNSQQITKLVDSLKQIQDTPYYKVATSNNDYVFSFVPYDNEKYAKEGESVYNCYLHMIACYKVGTISHVYKLEETANHVVFNKAMRGTLVELKLDDNNEAKSKVFFLGGKPLFI